MKILLMPSDGHAQSLAKALETTSLGRLYHRDGNGYSARVTACEGEDFLRDLAEETEAMAHDNGVRCAMSIQQEVTVIPF